MCPKQVDYLKEMREFEDEMNKHAHRYPNDILTYMYIMIIMYMYYYYHSYMLYSLTSVY